MTTATKSKKISAKRKWVTGYCGDRIHRTDICVGGKWVAWIKGNRVTLLGRNEAWLDIVLPKADSDKLKMYRAARKAYPRTPNREPWQSYGGVIYV
jgi:hypothetical protein